ncbi:LysR substrate-binding domain-containing protein [Paracoccus sp. (in: a-proteobacteria)]|uniref:LysR substrate-binding domain-containing protein n=1 Tax=Paracoccus sp. TaxID=267 RepID=UPI003A89BD60
MIDLRQLRYFVAIVEQGSISRAAGVLHVAQPALSLHVRNMEAHLGTALLFRTPRGVEPTEAGTILLNHARVILDQLTVAEEEIRGNLSDPSGDVRLGLPGTIAQILAVPLITATHRRYPKIRLRIAEAMSGFVLEWLRDGRVDLAVLYGGAEEQGIAAQPVLEEELQFFAPAQPAPDEALPPSGGLIAFRQVAGMPLILPGEGHGLRDQLERVAITVDTALNVMIDVDSYANIKALVHEGLGCSILPRNAIAADAAAGSLRAWQIAGPAIRRRVFLAHSSERPMTNAVATIRNLARDTLRDLARNDEWAGAALVGDEQPVKQTARKG